MGPSVPDGSIMRCWFVGVKLEESSFGPGSDMSERRKEVEVALLHAGQL